MTVDPEPMPLTPESSSGAAAPARSTNPAAPPIPAEGFPTLSVADPLHKDALKGRAAQARRVE